MKLNQKLAICNLKRTPFAQISKSLSHYKAYQLGFKVAKDILDKTKIDKEIDGVIVGESGPQVPNSARIISNLLKLSYEKPCITVNQNCASSLEAVAECARRILLKEGELFLAIGEESQTHTPFIIKNARTNKRTTTLDKLLKNISDLPENVEVIDTLEDGLGDSETSFGMPVTAEIIAQNYNITKELSDRFAYESFKRALEGFQSEKYQPFLINIEDEKGNLFKNDEAVFLRKGIVENPSRMQKAMLLFDNPHIKFDNFKIKYQSELKNIQSPTVSIFNSCARSDGAAACIITTLEKAKELNLNVDCILTGFQSKGVSPNIMGIGQSDSSLALLKDMNYSMKEVDQIEIHEAFSATALGALEDMKNKANLKWEKMFEDRKINCFGGSIAIGHPFGATGIRLIINAAMSFRENDSTNKILVTACAHGGVGSAFMLERY